MGNGNNRWGGKNRFSVYTPLSEIEQEAISRMVAASDIFVCIKGWGVVDKPRIIYGDLRLGVQWRMDFTAPEAPTPVHWFDLELRTRQGELLFKERQSTLYGGNPIQVCAGIYLDMVWDIALTALDPQIVKRVMPHAIGLTSRFQDKDTGEITLFGNQAFTIGERNALLDLRRAEAANREDTRQQVKKAEKKAIEDGVIIDPSKMT